MPMLNAAGQPVAMKPMSFQIDIPAEPVANIGQVDFFKVIGAVLQLMAAFATGNQAIIFAAIQAFFQAILGG